MESLWSEILGSNVKPYINSDFSHGKQTLFSLIIKILLTWALLAEIKVSRGLTAFSFCGATGGTVFAVSACTK